MTCNKKEIKDDVTFYFPHCINHSSIKIIQMNFNFLPTDNLFKFLAISGLFILIFNLYYSGEEYFKVREERAKFTSQLANQIELVKKVISKKEEVLEAIQATNQA